LAKDLQVGTKNPITGATTMTGPQAVAGAAGLKPPAAVAPVGPPPEAIAILRANPASAPHFQSTFGVDPSQYLPAAAPAPASP
jgi:hypothetical protein